MIKSVVFKDNENETANQLMDKFIAENGLRSYNIIKVELYPIVMESNVYHELLFVYKEKYAE